jgi:hypothetical protein
MTVRRVEVGLVYLPREKFRVAGSWNVRAHMASCVMGYHLPLAAPLLVHSRANHKLSLEEIELPQNHPFATKQMLSKEEHEQSLQNLRARSMRRRNYEAMQSAAEAANAGPGGMGRQR